MSALSVKPSGLHHSNRFVSLSKRILLKDYIRHVCWFHGDTEAIALLVSEGADLSVLRTEQRRLAGLIEQLEQGKVTA